MIYIIRVNWCVPHEASGTETYVLDFDGTKEELMFEFELAAEKAYKKENQWDFEFEGKTFTTSDFYEYSSYVGKVDYSAPYFYTFNEWLKYNGIDKEYEIIQS